MAPKIIVLDDDPTGSQTVHSCSLLLRWDVETLREALLESAPIFFILANTRAMLEAEAIATTREICINLKAALAAEKIKNFILVSRSDSTLRGHFPAEPEAIASVFGEFDACFHAPAFFEGGRVTIDGTHYIAEANQLTPVHTTEFAKDAIFGFSHSFLPDYIEEKTQGAIAAETVEILDAQQNQQQLATYLQGLTKNQQIVLSAATQSDFDQLVPALLEATTDGKKFIFRSAASLLTSLANLGKQPIAAKQMGQYRRSNHPGLILVGSHVAKTTVQLQELLKLPTIQGIEIDVLRCQKHEVRDTFLSEIQGAIATAFSQQLTPVIYTSRSFQSQTNQQEQLLFGETITQFLLEIVQALPSNLGFIISKGGNTSNRLLSHGLDLAKVQLLGQILAGCCLVKTTTAHPQLPDLPIVLFPGNVGDRLALVEVYRRLQTQ
ncbi:four-carbon acid sugar kinase family protein [[Limnothrix rosea] IAM M-220]|uniref:four-carbon acid sugar kinase family protein n=1 Tax=[Limnothrix rosea] IAM M-220 TaxID=454133 RepID=UPI0009653D64|nr:four-carbon acid sugar kinase family protein [[Limnothrix rosea] IAM M-220]OKH18003.1 Hrp-dependent type III effector protein [[Limnothrix rosea] IAM M-220]